MSTGYTYKIDELDDFTFEEFAWDCARAMPGLAGLTRSNLGQDYVIPQKIRPNSYQEEIFIRKCEDELQKLECLTDEELGRKMEADRKDTLRTYEGWQEARKKRRAKFEAMLAKVEAWKLPTSEHGNLQAFMLQQLKLSLEFADLESTEECIRRLKKPVEVEDIRKHRLAQIGDLRKDIQRSRERIAREKEWAEQVTSWLKALRDSLGEPPKPR